MNKLFLIVLTILIILWICGMTYFIITENWIELIKNILILFVSFISGITYATITKGVINNV